MHSRQEVQASAIQTGNHRSSIPVGGRWICWHRTGEVLPSYKARRTEQCLLEGVGMRQSGCSTSPARPPSAEQVCGKGLHSSGGNSRENLGRATPSTRFAVLKGRRDLGPTGHQREGRRVTKPPTKPLHAQALLTPTLGGGNWEVGSGAKLELNPESATCQTGRLEGTHSISQRAGQVADQPLARPTGVHPKLVYRRSGHCRNCGSGWQRIAANGRITCGSCSRRLSPKRRRARAG